MRTQSLLVAVIVVVVILAFRGGGSAQTKTFTTPWGHPDLQGVWNNQTPVPMERPKELGNKATFTKEEAAAAEQNHAKTIVGFINQVDPTNACPPEKEAGCIESLAVWLDTVKVARNLRTSLVVSPANGQIPYTAEGRKRWLSSPTGIATEGKEPGDSRGHWEGQTLVVETTNYDDRMLFRGATRNLRTVERFTRVAADAIDYRVTFTDPATYATPWTVENTMWKSDAGMYEADCHEGNYGLANILSAARAEEKKK